MVDALGLLRPSAFAIEDRGGRLRRRARFGSNTWLLYAGILCVCTAFALPFAWMIFTSLKTPAETIEYPPHFLPRVPQPDNYRALLTHPNFSLPVFTRNTLIVAALTTLGTTLSSAMVAYGFARFNFRGRRLLFIIMLATMMIPYPVIMVPTFRLFRWFDQLTAVVLGPGSVLQMMGTFKPLWLPAWFGNAFSIFLLRQFFLGQPRDLIEAAQLDGCGEFGTFWRIAMPLARPAVAVVALLAFMGTWNDFLGPLIYLQEPRQYTLSLGLQAFQSQQGGTEWNLLMAASTVVCLPLVLLFFLTQRSFLNSFSFGSAR